jgi:hypothetical protein
MNRTTGLCMALLCLAMPAMTASGWAAEDEHEKSGLSFGFGNAELTLTLDAGFGLFGVANAQNGLGSLSGSGARSGGRNWAEGFIAPGLGLEYRLDETTLYTRAKLIGAATRGEGEAQRTSLTSGRPERLELDEAVVGWKSGIAFAALGEDAVDVSAGRQGFVVGDGFLIADGMQDGGRRAAYVLGPRGSFDRTAILRLNTQPVRADLFHLEGNVDQRAMRGQDAAGTSLYGGNLEWFGSAHKDHGRFEYEERAWYLGLTALKAYDADRAFNATRDGLSTWAVRSGGAVLEPLHEAFADFSLFSEYARQSNDIGTTKVRARAWYVEPQYTVSALPWSPRISYRYAHFSGDDNANDNRQTGWDTLYMAGGPRGYGSWDQGEIFARYVGSNTNLNSQMAQLKLQPLDELSIGAIWYRHRFDKPDTANGVTSKALLNELDVFAVWETPLPGLTVSSVLGAAKAGDGRRQQQGTADATDRTTWLGQIVLGYSF